MEKLTGIKLHEGLVVGYIYVYEDHQDELIYWNDRRPMIMASENFTPSETVSFGRINVGALVVTNATLTSHTAILSRTMDWPAVSGVKIKSKWHHKLAIVDGYSGILWVDPDEDTLHHYNGKQREEDEKKARMLTTYIRRKAVTKSGKDIKLYANISTPSDISKVISNDAEGIGNFKTEFMYLNVDDYPTEEALFQTYKTIVSQMSNRRVVIRTFDIGTDKVADYFELDKEENPALGYRAIRIGLDRPEILKTQLKAIIRASAFGLVSLLYPMIVSVEEVLEIKRLVREVMGELKNKGIAFNENIEQGIMIETPAAVIMSYELAQVVDFFSIGTNDLIQYTLAADRQNPRLSHIYNPYHPAILRSIQYVVENAHKAGIWVEISGEMGADFTLIKRFLEYGVDALAVSPTKILPLRKLVCEME